MRVTIAKLLLGLTLLVEALWANGPRHGSSRSHHYSYQGGHYPSGRGSSHKGGYYVNSRTGNHYNHHS